MPAFGLFGFPKAAVLEGEIPAPAAARLDMKSSILLFDFVPGTKVFTVPQGVTRLRRACVGGGGNGASTGAYLGGCGGGYAEDIVDVLPGQQIPYTVAGPQGTSAIAGVLAATGGQDGSSYANVGGIGSGGLINRRGGGPGGKGGASSANRLCDGLASEGDQGGAGWADPGSTHFGGAGAFDGFGLGIPSGRATQHAYYGTQSGTTLPGPPGDYGSGGGVGTGGQFGGRGGIGGGGANPRGKGGVGGGGGADNSNPGSGGPGAVIFEAV